MEIDDLTPTQFQILRLWELGFSGAEVAQQVGMTRSAVMGVLGRLRFKGVAMRNHEKDRAEKVLRDAVEGRVPKKKSRKRKYHSDHRMGKASVKVSLPWHNNSTEKNPPQVIQPTEIRGDEIDILGLTIDTCRYINGETDGFDTLYCGKFVARGVYCAEHAELCYCDSHRDRYAKYVATKPAPAG